MASSSTEHYRQFDRSGFCCDLATRYTQEFKVVDAEAVQRIENFWVIILYEV